MQQIQQGGDRSPPRLNVQLLIRLGDFATGHTRNMSITGFFVETSARPEIGTRLELLLSWDAETHGCTVRVVRHAEDGIGVAFEDPDTFFNQAIREIIAESTRQAHLKAV